MPATPAARALDLADDLCGTCLGSGEEIDRDGALTGLPDALLPCGECGTHTPHDRPEEHCICWLPLWRRNGGHTGWVPVPIDYVDDGRPMFTACLAHNTALRAALVGVSPLQVVAA